MSWPTGNVRQFLVDLRSQLNACATWVSSGGTTGKIHYPHADDTAPSDIEAVLYHQPGERSRIGWGMSNRTGEAEIQLNGYDIDIAAMEYVADKIADELITDTGIAGLRVTGIEFATEPTDAEQETDDADLASTAIISLSYGLEVSE